MLASQANSEAPTLQMTRMENNLNEENKHENVSENINAVRDAGSFKSQLNVVAGVIKEGETN